MPPWIVSRCLKRYHPNRPSATCSHAVEKNSSGGPHDVTPASPSCASSILPVSSTPWMCAFPRPWISNSPTGVPGFTARRRIERRNQNYQVKKISLSGCDHSKTLAHFDFSAAPGINRILIQDLAACVFIQRHENLLMCGPTGTGKSHLAMPSPLKPSNATSASWQNPLIACCRSCRLPGQTVPTLASLLVLWLTICSFWMISACNPFLRKLSRISTRSLPNAMNAAP